MDCHHLLNAYYADQKRNFRGAYLTGCFIMRVPHSFKGADFYGAYLQYAYFENVTFEGALNIFCETLPSARTAYFVRHKVGWMVKYGEFWGCLQQFKERFTGEEHQALAKKYFNL